MPTEVDLALTWIENTLQEDATLLSLAPGGVFQTFQLPGTTAPYKIVKYLNGTDVPKFGGIAYSDMHFRVIVAGPFDALQNLQAAAKRINDLLTVTQQTALSGGTLMSSIRAQPISDDEWADSAKWRVEGGEYRIMAKAS